MCMCAYGSQLAFVRVNSRVCAFVRCDCVRGVYGAVTLSVRIRMRVWLCLCVRVRPRARLCRTCTRWREWLRAWVW